MDKYGRSERSISADRFACRADLSDIAFGTQIARVAKHGRTSSVRSGVLLEQGIAPIHFLS